jgi:hypothetical protein
MSSTLASGCFCRRGATNHFDPTRSPYTLLLTVIRAQNAARHDETEPAPDLAERRDLPRGRSVILIGGVRRRHAHEAIREAFELQELEWVEMQEHESISTFEPYVARPDVAVVLLAIAGPATRSATCARSASASASRWSGCLSGITRVKLFTAKRSGRREQGWSFVCPAVHQ